jgi:hypothetical protein
MGLLSTRFMFARPLYSLDLTALGLSNGSNSATLRTLLDRVSVARASSTTVQTAIGALVASSIGVDDPALGDFGYGQGLIHWPSRTNRVINATTFGGADWSVGSGATRTSGKSDPTGGTGAYEITATSGNFGLAETIQTGSDTRLFGSLWLRAASASVAGDNLFRATAATRAYDTVAVPTTWVRRILDSGTMAAQSTAIVLVDGRDFSASGGSAAGARDHFVYGVQREAGTYATDLILTSGAAATRAGQQIKLATTGLFSAGRFGMWLRYVAGCSIGGSNDETAAMRFATIDANNFVSINQTTGVPTVTVAGAGFTASSGATNAIGDVVDLWVEAGGTSLQTVVKARKNGGATSTLGTSGSPQGAITEPSTMDLLCNGTASQLPGALQRVEVYAAGSRPSWAA